MFLYEGLPCDFVFKTEKFKQLTAALESFLLLNLICKSCNINFQFICLVLVTLPYMLSTSCRMYVNLKCYEVSYVYCC